jgi:hypothetical protein
MFQAFASRIATRSRQRSLTGLLLRLSSVVSGLVASAALALVSPSAWAGPLYSVFVTGGDVTGLTTINSNGDVLFESGQACGALPCSYVLAREGSVYPTGAPYTPNGLPYAGAPTGSAAYSRITSFNSAGDMAGVSTPSNTATFWRLGVAFDLTLPANAGLVVAPEADVRFDLVDVSTLTLQAPTGIFVSATDLSRIASYNGRAWQNARGDIAFQAPIFNSPTVILRPVLTVPEPGTAVLAASILLLMGALRARRI